MLGCFVIEILSKYKVWSGFSENEIIKHLKNSSSPKVPNDIPPNLWGLIHECINPFYNARADVKDILIRYYFLMQKLGNGDVVNRISSNILFD
jgi:serine/threonine protein kinase